MTAHHLVESMSYSVETRINSRQWRRVDRNIYIDQTSQQPNPLDCQIGRTIYEKFNTVVLLKEQMRITDPIWYKLLSNLQKGQMGARFENAAQTYYRWLAER
jgi:hypothetical protein